jgi:hypothetical protein
VLGYGVEGYIHESPFEGAAAAPSAGGYIDLSYSAGLDPSGGSVTPPPPLASSSRFNLAISDSYLSSTPCCFLSTRQLTPDEFSDEQSLVHIMIVESIQVLVLVVVLS